MKIYFLLLIFLFTQIKGFTANICIIECQSLLGKTQDMDEVWKGAAISMNHSAAIFPQSLLDNLSNLETFDALIISSGEIDISPNRVDNILNYILLGGNVYIQSEYLSNNITNQVFKQLVTELGGTFEWKNHYSDWIEMSVLAPYTSPFNIDHVKSFYYSVSGIGDCRTISFLEAFGEFHGFQYIPIQSSYGALITTTDQDWIIGRSSIQLMKNIISNLISPPYHLLEIQEIQIGNDTILCKGDSLLLDVSYFQASTYSWSTGQTTSNILVKESGEYVLTIENNCGVLIGKITVTFIDSITTELIADSIICVGETLILSVNSIGGSFLWSDGSTNNSIYVTNQGLYSVTIEDACKTDTIYKVVSIGDCKCEIFTPNIFTPNGDNFNDEYKVSTNCEILDFYISIFDRWGTLVYSSTNLNFIWNGKHRDTDLPSGVYAYIIKYKYTIEEEKGEYGSITLIR